MKLESWKIKLALKRKGREESTSIKTSPLSINTLRNMKKILEVEGGFIAKEYDEKGSIISQSQVFATEAEAEAGVANDPEAEPAEEVDTPAEEVPAPSPESEEAEAPEETGDEKEEGDAPAPEGEGSASEEGFAG